MSSLPRSLPPTQLGVSPLLVDRCALALLSQFKLLLGGMGRGSWPSWFRFRVLTTAKNVAWKGNRASTLENIKFWTGIRASNPKQNRSHHGWQEIQCQVPQTYTSYTMPSWDAETFLGWNSWGGGACENAQARYISNSLKYDWGGNTGISARSWLLSLSILNTWHPKFSANTGPIMDFWLHFWSDGMSDARGACLHVARKRQMYIITFCKDWIGARRNRWRAAGGLACFDCGGSGARDLLRAINWGPEVRWPRRRSQELTLGRPRWKQRYEWWCTNGNWRFSTNLVLKRDINLWEIHQEQLSSPKAPSFSSFSGGCELDVACKPHRKW